MEVAGWITFGAFAGAVIGYIVARIVGANRGNKNLNEFASWLGKPCWLKVNHTVIDEAGNILQVRQMWVKHRVVGVSWKGSILVRKWEDESGRHAFWIDKEDVAFIITFEDPGIREALADQVFEQALEEW